MIKAIWIGSWSGINLKSKIMNLKLVGILAIGVTFVMCGGVAQAQEAGKMRLIGHVSHRPGPSGGDEAFLKALRDLGWIEGQNITFEYRWAARKWDRVPALIEELINLKVDILVTSTRPIAQAAKNATTTIPIVMASGSDAVENGLVASLARPGGNLTGMSEQYSAMHTKLLELIHETLPKVTRVSSLGNPNSPTHVRVWKVLKATAPALGLRIQPLTLRHADELESALDTAVQERAGALIVPAQTYTRLGQRISKFVAKERVPVFSLSYGSVRRHFGLLAYSPDWSDMRIRAATYVDKILRGAKPSDLPVQRPQKFRMVVNLKTAKALGITIPPTVLYKATRVIK